MRWITGVVAEINRRLFAHLSEHSATYFSDRYAGALVNKIGNAASGTGRLISQWLWQFFPWIVGLVADLRITYLAHPRFALGARGLDPGVYVPINVFFVSPPASPQLPIRRGFFDPPRARWWTARPTSTPSSSPGRRSTRRRHIGEYVGHQRCPHLREWWWSEWLLVTNGVLLAAFILRDARPAGSASSPSGRRQRGLDWSW